MTKPKHPCTARQMPFSPVGEPLAPARPKPAARPAPPPKPAAKAAPVNKEDVSNG